MQLHQRIQLGIDDIIGILKGSFDHQINVTAASAVVGARAK